jgi:hypothetical protein
MPVAIVLNQIAAPPGVPGFAREDFVTGSPVTIAAVGGPYFAYQWRIIDKPIDLTVPVQATTVIGVFDAASTTLSPIDLPGTYLIELLVDSGSGLGATDQDVARITFYANDVSMPLSTDAAEMPRRTPAFRERLEHNVPETLFPGGNPRGWAEERLRFDEAILRMYQGKSYAHGRVNVAGAGTSLVDAFNSATATWTALGVVDIVFTRPLQNNLYTVNGNTLFASGFFKVTNMLNTGFTAIVTDNTDAAADLDFCYDVKFNPFPYQ